MGCPGMSILCFYCPTHLLPRALIMTWDVGPYVSVRQAFHGNDEKLNWMECGVQCGERSVRWTETPLWIHCWSVCGVSGDRSLGQWCCLWLWGHGTVASGMPWVVSRCITTGASVSGELYDNSRWHWDQLNSHEWERNWPQSASAVKCWQPVLLDFKGPYRHLPIEMVVQVACEKKK